MSGAWLRHVRRAVPRPSSECVPARGGDDGFSLLEVMIAMAILALSLTVVSQAQQSAMRQIRRSKMMTLATLLAREKMVDIEDDLFKDGFSDFEEEETGDFSEEGHKDLQWRLKIEKVELPQQIDADAIGDAVGGGIGGSGTGGSGASGGLGGGMAQVGGQLIGQQFQMFRNVLEQSIRRVHLEVSWPDGAEDRAVTVVAYFTDPRKVDAAAGGAGALGGTAGTTTPGSTSPTSPSLPGTTTPTNPARPTSGIQVIR